MPDSLRADPVDEILAGLPEDLRERDASDLHNWAREDYPTYVAALRTVVRWPQYQPPVPPPPTLSQVQADHCNLSGKCYTVMVSLTS